MCVQEFLVMESRQSDIITSLPTDPLELWECRPSERLGLQLCIREEESMLMSAEDTQLAVPTEGTQVPQLKPYRLKKENTLKIAEKAWDF